MITRSFTLVTLAMIVLSVPASRGASSLAQTAPPAGFIITNVRVFDGDRVHERTQVAVEGGIIRAVGPELGTWRHLPAIDGSGATLLPGLIDAHAHVRNLEDLADALRFGVTTVLDLGASGVTPSQQSELRATAARRMDVADLRYAGYVATAPGGHGTELRNPRIPNPPTVERAVDAVSFVVARKSEGSDYLKIAINGVRTADQGLPTLDEARVTALVDAAHQQGLLTIAHIETVGDTEIALASGVDSLAHVWRRGGANLDLARRIAARKVPVTLTLAIPDGRLPPSRESLLGDERLRPLLDLRRPLLLWLRERELELARFGTLPPSRRASDRPIAIACLRLLTVLPERPLLSWPRFISCMALSTLLLAFFPYLGMGVPSFRK